MRVDESRSADSLSRPEGNSLKENYSLHDVGSEHLVSLIDEWNEDQTHWEYDILDVGIDMRDEDEVLIYDDKMDYTVVDVDPSPHEDTHRYVELADIDVKTKTSQKWMNVFNLRHYAHYVAQNNHTKYKDAYVFMCLLDDGEVDEINVLPVEENDMAIEYEAYFDPEKESTIESYGECVDDFEYVDSAFIAPDRNPVIRFDESYLMSVDEWVEEVL